MSRPDRNLALIVSILVITVTDGGGPAAPLGDGKFYVEVDQASCCFLVPRCALGWACLYKTFLKERWPHGLRVERRTPRLQQAGTRDNNSLHKMKMTWSSCFMAGLTASISLVMMKASFIRLESSTCHICQREENVSRWR